MLTAPLGTRLLRMGGGLMSLLLVVLTAQLTHADHQINGVPPSIMSTEMPAEVVVNLNLAELNGQVANLILPCPTTGVPQPTVTWFRGDTEIDAAFVADDGQLAMNVTNTTTSTYAARGGTIYYCVATNMIGPENSTLARVRSGGINVTHNYFGGFTATTPVVQMIPTVTGRSVALECDYEPSNPPPMVQWFWGDIQGPAEPSTLITEDTNNNNRLLVDGGRYLFIRQLTDEDRNRRYQCEVTNFDARAPTQYRLDGAFTNNTLFVYKELGTQIGVLGSMEEVDFVYSAARMDEASILLGVCPTVSGVSIDVSTALIAVATLGDNVPEDQPEVEFTCELFVQGVRSEISGTLVLSRPASIRDLPADAPPLLDRDRIVGGGAVVYPCAASGTPAPTVTWYYNGRTNLGSGVEVDGSGTLTIAEPLVSHSGIYQCIVANEFGSGNRTWLLEVREPEFPVIAPLINTTEEAVEDRLEGTLVVHPFGTANVVINTVVTSDPCPSVRWTFRGRTGTLINVTNGTDYTMSNPCLDEETSSSYNFTLTIASLVNGTSGEYAALFTVLDTVVTTEPLFVTVPVTNVLRSLDIVIESGTSPAPMCLLEGSSVTFTCNVTGFPRHDITFSKGPNPVPLGERVTRLNNDQLRISNINASDEGQYTCEVTVPGMGGTPQNVLRLNPTPPPLEFCTLPMITDFTATQDPREGSELVIECVVEGTPIPVVTWTRDNVTLDADDPNIFISISPDHQIMIDQVMTEDSGVYSCRATNPAGSSEQSMLIDVQGRDLRDIFTTAVIIGIVAGGCGLILLIVLLVLLLICVYVCARKKSSGSADFRGYSYPAVSGDGRGNVDDDSYDGGQPEAFEPDYDSVPTRRPNEPPPYKDTPGYQHGAPMAGDDMEMMKYPPPDSDFVSGGQPPYLRPSQDNGYRQTPNAEDFLSEDAQFV